jgi:hypothetical protein
LAVLAQPKPQTAFLRSPANIGRGRGYTQLRGFDGVASGRAGQPTHCRNNDYALAQFLELVRRDRRSAASHRAEGFRKVFDHLDRFDRPVGIVETGCVRQQDNWAGDGQSTILFDRYAEFHPRSAVFSVDRDPEAAALCRSLVGGHVRIHAGDRLAYLKSLADHPPAGLEFLDLLYLDSFDVDFDDPLASAIHHLKELPRNRSGINSSDRSAHTVFSATRMK